MIKAIDFFCGAGGLTRGLLNVNINVLAGVDNDPLLKLTYENNNKPSRFICQDIRNIDIDDLRKSLDISSSDVVLYAACTPCQPFSTLNRMKGEDDRKVLLLAFAKLVKKSPPDFIIVENVPGLNTKYGKEVYEQFAQILDDCHFQKPSTTLLNAKEFGVPQVRKRFILLASRHNTVALPQPDKEEPSTVEQYLKKYPPLEDGAKSPDFPNHVTRKLLPHIKQIVQAVPKNGGSRRDIEDTSILLKCHQSRPNVHRDVFGRMAWNKPAPTLTCRCADVYCGRFIHPEQDRGISLREAAALQTFEDDYEFFGKFFHIQRQIGNAVPVKLAERLGKAILDSTYECEIGISSVNTEICN